MQLSCAERAATPIEEKESHRWVSTLQQANEEAQRCPTTRFVCVADSEGDIYEVLVEGTREPGRSNWIVAPARTAPCSVKMAETVGKSTYASSSWNSPRCLQKRSTSAGVREKLLAKPVGDDNRAVCAKRRWSCGRPA